MVRSSTAAHVDHHDVEQRERRKRPARDDRARAQTSHGAAQTSCDASSASSVAACSSSVATPRRATRCRRRASRRARQASQLCAPRRQRAARCARAALPFGGRTPCANCSGRTLCRMLPCTHANRDERVGTSTASVGGRSDAGAVRSSSAAAAARPAGSPRLQSIAHAREMIMMKQKRPVLACSRSFPPECLLCALKKNPTPPPAVLALRHDAFTQKRKSTTARPLDRSTAEERQAKGKKQKHDRSTARPLDRSTARPLELVRQTQDRQTGEFQRSELGFLSCFTLRPTRISHAHRPA